MSGDEAGAGNHSYAGYGVEVECFLQHCLTNLGVGYFIVIALGFLILVSSILLASYVCCHSARHQQQPSPLPEGVSLPSVVFVAEDDQEPGVPGLDSDVIASYPKFIFSKTKGGGFFGEVGCSICLGDYKDGEVMRMLPDCRHFFHLGCVDSWLRLKASCPICRTSPMPTPISTPLSEFLPLFHYPVNHGR